jgi:hypothetical protein
MRPWLGGGSKILESENTARKNGPLIERGITFLSGHLQPIYTPCWGNAHAYQTISAVAIRSQTFVNHISGDATPLMLASGRPSPANTPDMAASFTMVRSTPKTKESRRTIDFFTVRQHQAIRQERKKKNATSNLGMAWNSELLHRACLWRLSPLGSR